MDKKELAKKSLEALNELEQSLGLENIIKDNKVEFQVNKKTYRIRKPSLIEQKEINDTRRKKYGELIDDDSYLFRKQWIEKYKKKGIDIDKMDVEIATIQSEVKTLLLRLAKTTDKKELENLKGEITSKRNKQLVISMEKTDLLSYSIEDQLLMYVNAYTTYLILETKKEDKWVRSFQNYEAFMQSKNAELINQAFYFSNMLLYSIEE